MRFKWVENTREGKEIENTEDEHMVLCWGLGTHTQKYMTV